MSNRPYLLAVGAGTLLALSFPPTHLWLLLVPAMALYFYIAADSARTQGEVFKSTFIIGAMLGLWTAYNGLSHMLLLPGATTFSQLVHISPFFIACLFGDVFAIVALAYRALLTRSVLLNGLLGASLYTAGELFQQFVWGGYYWGSFAHAAVPLAPALTIAALGGTFLVSFLVAWSAATAAHAQQWRAALPSAAVFCVVCISLYVGARLAVPAGESLGSFKIAIVQATGEDLSFTEDSAFTGGSAYDRLITAGRSGADLTVYPYTPTKNWTLYQGPKTASEVRNEPIPAALGELNQWIASAVAPTTTALVWQNVYNSNTDRFYETFQFIKDGKTEAQYHKQRLYPYTDYFPAWMLRFGLAQRDDALTRGPAVSYTQVGQWRIGGLDCSETNLQDLARLEARNSDFLLSVGSDAMFQNEAPARYSLASARYRAAENRIPTVRAALFGPSAIINPDGSLAAYLAPGARDILQGTVELSTVRQTPYNRFGSAPLFSFVAAVLVTAALMRLYLKRATTIL